MKRARAGQGCSILPRATTIRCSSGLSPRIRSDLKGGSTPTAMFAGARYASPIRRDCDEAAPTGNIGHGSIGVSGSAVLGISSAGTLASTQIVAQIQGSPLVGGGFFVGGGPTVAVGVSQGPLPPGVSQNVEPHAEFNVGLPGVGSGSVGVDFQNGSVTGGQGFIRGPNIGPGGIMVGAGPQATIKIASPTAGQIWNYIRNLIGGSSATPCWP